MFIMMHIELLKVTCLIESPFFNISDSTFYHLWHYTHMHESSALLFKDAIMHLGIQFVRL